MPRGARKDKSVTALLFRNGIFADKRSFVSSNYNEPHLFLFGADKSAQRVRVFIHHRNKCCVCRAEIWGTDDAPNQMRGDWHHPKNCDCIPCSEIRCSTLTGRDCHAHRTLGFRRSAKEQRKAKKAIRDFKHLYPEGEQKCLPQQPEPTS
jgi:hypothetical protein